MHSLFVFCTVKSPSIAYLILDILHPLSADIYASASLPSATTQECLLLSYDNQISYEAG